MKLDIPDSFLKEEVRCDYTVSEEMKRCWAASLKILSVIDDICKQNGIRYFAMYGTLLGAVRHKGFIPWDDDVDIGMLRSDYDRFFAIAAKAMPYGYQEISYRTFAGYEEVVRRISNGYDLTKESIEWRKNNFYGFPYVVGVDVFPMDYIPENPEERDLFYQILYILMSAIECFKADSKTTAEQNEKILGQIETMLNVSIRRDGTELSQLLYLAEYVSASYGPEDSGTIGEALDHMGGDVAGKYLMPVSLYQDLTDIDFEMVKIPVPRDYDRLLKGIFGEQYMNPVKYHAHDFPFYNKQKRQMEESGIVL